MPSELPGRNRWASERDGMILYALTHNGREWGSPGASRDYGTLAYYRHVAGLFLVQTDAEPVNEWTENMRSLLGKKARTRIDDAGEHWVEGVLCQFTDDGEVVYLTDSDEGYRWAWPNLETVAAE